MPTSRRANVTRQMYAPLGNGALDPAIAVHDLVKDFGEVRAVRGVEFEVAHRPALSSRYRSR